MIVPMTPRVFINRNSWRDWLSDNHSEVKEIWLVIRRAGCADPGLRLDEAVEEALCFGWIDSQLKPIDHKSYSLRFSPRRVNSIWAESNIMRVRKMIKEGKMTPDGLAVVPERIKKLLEES